MTRASACGSSWLSVESRRVALATIATPSRADAPRRRPVAAVRHATAAEAPATHWAGRQKARAALASATRLMSESDRASFAAFDVEFVVEISRCRAPLHRSTTHAVRPAVDVELYSATALYSALQLYSSTALYILYTLVAHREFVNGRLRSRTPTTGLVHQPRRTMAPSTTSLHRRTPSPPPALGHPSRPPTGCRSSHPNLSAFNRHGANGAEPSRMPASRAAPRSPAEARHGAAGTWCGRVLLERGNFLPMPPPGAPFGAHSIW